jgi:hypothetical protein
MDREIGDMTDDVISGKPLLSYLRYNFAITKDNLNALGLQREFDDHDVMSIADMAKSKNKELLYEIGYNASSVIKPEHFGGF